jgi:hypothetical protein
MSYFMYIFCESGEPVGLPDIVEFINDGMFFDELPVCTPDSTGGLGRLVIHYEKGRQPITVKRVQPNEEESLKGETVDATYRAHTDEREKADLRQRVESARQIICLQLDREDITENAWAMLDCLENHLIKNRKGVLYAYGDGFYGPGLKLIASLRKE